MPLRIDPNTKIQAVNLDVTEVSKRSVTSQLRSSVENAYDVVIERDDFIIRYSDKVKTYAHIEAYIGCVNTISDEVPARYLILVEQPTSAGITYIVVVVENNIPRDVQPKTIDAVKRLLGGCEYVYFDAPSLIDTHENWVEIETPEVDLSLELKSQGERLKKFIPPIAITLIIVMSGIGFQAWSRYTTNQTLPVIERRVLVDPFEQYKNAQENKISAGKVLFAAKRGLVTYRNEMLPPGWTFDNIQLSGRTLTGPIGMRVGVNSGQGALIRQMKDFIDTHPSGDFLFVRGQNAGMNIPLVADGQYLSQFQTDFVELREMILDGAMLLGANSINSNAESKFGNYRTQTIRMSFTGMSLLELGRLSRLMANQTVYADSLEIQRNGTLVSIDLTLSIFGTEPSNNEEA
ncbi:hypothetical protein [Photobacterium lutimaris]|uniref:Uncharacterized protein n=1 Tax=Photobacterium lutimaris TaxID=388278 RepID=A0A2T3ITY4_9GAMM|nr:hypothetical protein [Photobacterium lutimaris]PSU31813.1 hypothetical protein C9I99_21755 [Photobacterium lutimaris]TDR72535.1 hypothetical protein DFP78_11311 [Photobacterium lutimaris]